MASESRAARPWTGVLTVLLCSGAALLLYPYSFGLHSNHSIQIALVNLLHDPSLYAGDAFMATMDGYATYFWPAVAWATRDLPMQPVFFAGHLLTLVATYGAVYAIARAIDRHDPWAPHLACWIYLWWSQEIGGESLHWFYWAHTPVATAIGFWALALVLRARWLWAFAAAGLAFDVQALQGVYLLGALTVAWIVERRSIGGRLLLGWGIWALVAAPAFPLIAASSGGAGAGDMAAILRAFFPAHFFASSFAADEWLATLFAIALFVVCTAVTYRERAAARAIAMGAALVAFMVAGGVIADVAPINALLKLHVFRASSFFLVLTFALAAVVASRLAAARSRGAGQALLAIAVLFALATLAPVFPYLADGKRIVLAALALLAVLCAAGVWRPRAATLACAVVVSAVLGAWLTYQRLTDPYAYFGDSNVYEQDGDWTAVQRWARDNTEPGDRFLTPPYLEGFRVFSQRPVAGEWKDAAAVMWSAEYTDYWRTWYTRMGGTFEPSYSAPIWKRLERAWTSLSLADVERLARDYDADYVLLRRDDYERIAWGGELLYDGPLFVVVASR